MAGEGVCAWNVDTGDVDKDGVTEIITVGYAFVGIECNGHLRVWSISREPTPFPYGLCMTVATGAILAFAAAYLYVRKKTSARKLVLRGLGKLG